MTEKLTCCDKDYIFINTLMDGGDVVFVVVAVCRLANGQVIKRLVHLPATAPASSVRATTEPNKCRHVSFAHCQSCTSFG